MKAVLILALASLGLGADPVRASGPATPAFVIDGGTHVTLAGTTRLVLGVDLLDFGVFSPSPGGTVIVGGYGARRLIGVPTFADLTMAMGRSGVATIDRNVQVAGSLALDTGMLSVNGHDLTVNSLSGGSAASYVMTPDTLGRLVRTVTPSPSVAFPVGNSAYDPVSLHTGVGSDPFRVAVTDSVPLANLVAATALTRAWAIAGSHATGIDGSIVTSVQWNAPEQGAAFDRTLLSATSAVAVRWNGSAWSPDVSARRSDNGGAFPAIDTLSVPVNGLWTLAGVSQLLAVGDGAAAPRGLQLAAGEPNPFAGATRIRYGLPRDGRVQLAVYSLLGERVATLVDGIEEAGWHVATLAGARLAGGVYFCRLDACGATQTRKIVLVR